MRRVAAVMTALLLALAGCSGGPAPGLSGTLTIVASPSLTDAITGMAAAFTGTYPGVRIDTVFAPDSAIARGGATPAPDLIAAEDPATVLAGGGSGTPVPFAQGQLVLAVPTEKLGLVRGLEDIARPEVRVALCAASEPCGEVAEAVLAAAGITPGAGALREPDVRSALRRVAEGAADAALVYRSDAIAAGEDVIAIELPTGGAALALFAAAVAAGTPNPSTARAFLDYLTSVPVRSTLVSDGFAPPPTPAS
jgi:molybdate transport system substrate-binding protein